MSALAEKLKGEKISAKDIFSIVYHDKFDYPLKLEELNRWKLGNYLIINSAHVVEAKDGHIFVKGKKNLIIKRILREKISFKKMRIAKKATKLLSLIPTVKMVAVTGSLSMLNADIDSDIDLMIITSKGALWTTRLISYILLKWKKIKIRKVGDLLEKDKLCINIWLDENYLSWKKRNIYTAHEIAQMVPLYDKEKTYQKFLEKNKWVRLYWPNAVAMRQQESGIKNKELGKKGSFVKFLIHNSLFIIPLLEPLAYYTQYFYMKRKITKEQIGKGRAIFHPVDWSGFILKQLSS